MAAKEKKIIRTEKKPKTFFRGLSLDKFIPRNFKYSIFALNHIVNLCSVFLLPLYFGGKTFQSGDIITSHECKNLY